MIAIIGAMEEELQPLYQQLQKQGVSRVGPATFSEGGYKGNPILVVQTGIGKANAAASTAILMEKYKPEAIFNIGTAGGLSQQLQVGDIVLASQTVYGDVDATGFGYHPGQVPRMPPCYDAGTSLLEAASEAAKGWADRVHVGLTMTTDSFMSDVEYVRFLQRKFPSALATDMEATANAQIAFWYGIPFLNIRIISDLAGQNASESFDENIQLVPNKAIRFLEAVLEIFWRPKA